MTEVNKLNGKGRKTLDVDYLLSLTPIKTWLVDNFIPESEVKRYLAALNQMYPDILASFGDFDKFLALDSNKKANFFNKWVEDKADQKIQSFPEKDRSKVKSTYQVYAWNVQGLLSRMGPQYKANPKTVKKIDSNTNLFISLTRTDVETLFTVLPPNYQLMLKILFLWGGMNPKDIVSLTLNDFKQYDTDFYYIQKARSKTEKKGGKIFNICHKELYQDIKHYAEIEKHGNNDPIFDLTEGAISDTFRNYVLRYEINKECMPKIIRQLASTLLKKILPEDFLLLWTQHKPRNIVEANYIKNIPDLIALYPKIVEAVLLGNGYKHQLEVEQDIRKENALLRAKQETQEVEIKDLKTQVAEIPTIKAEAEEQRKQLREILAKLQSSSQ